MTPPFNISAIPRLTRLLPVTGALETSGVDTKSP
jgi:hypothetical protein